MTDVKELPVWMVTEKTIKDCISCGTRLKPCYHDGGTFADLLICPRCDC